MPLSYWNDNLNNKKTIGFIGAHMDDIELSCGGTIQMLKQKGFRIIGLVITKDLKRIKAVKETSQLLGYKLIFGGISENKIELGLVRKIILKKLVIPFTPFLVFGHSFKDDHYQHVIVGTATDSACAGVPNLFHFCGPLRKTEFTPNVFFTFSKKEYQKKIKAIKILRKAYGPTRYFTQEYLMENVWLGQKVFEYCQREKAPYIETREKKFIPYAEGFEVRRLRDPF
jgi:LmbE family N-acetylglucosaminyl deacetylase